MELTPEARMVLELAEKEARRYQQYHVSTEHLLLGLLRQGDEIVIQAITSCNPLVTLESVRSHISFITGIGDRVVTDYIGLTPRAQKAIRGSVQQAERFNHTRIYPAHLLLGLVYGEECIAAGVLRLYGVTFETLKEVTEKLLSVRTLD